jgi:hypothetical protein
MSQRFTWRKHVLPSYRNLKAGSAESSGHGKGRFVSGNDPISLRNFFSILKVFSRVLSFSVVPKLKVRGDYFGWKTRKNSQESRSQQMPRQSVSQVTEIAFLTEEFGFLTQFPNPPLFSFKEQQQ